MRLLLCGDVASNHGNRPWISAVGADHAQQRERTIAACRAPKV